MKKERRGKKKKDHEQRAGKKDVSPGKKNTT